MKKIFKLAALVAATAALFACNKPNTKPGVGAGEDEGDDYVAAITIDGNFDDWAALEGNTYLVKATSDPGSERQGFIEAKFYMDEVYVNIYIKYNPEVIVEKSPWGNGTVHAYIDTDNSDATGGYGDQFTDANADFVWENSIFGEDGNFCSWDPALFSWWGKVGANGWLWTDPSTDHNEADFWGAIVTNGSGLGEGAGAGNEYEMRIVKELCPGVVWADTIGIGLDIQQGWNSVGSIPNGPVDETVSADDPRSHGIGAKAKVTCAK